VSKTQENCHAPGHQERQQKIIINDEEFWADPEMIPLLRALNEAGLKTRSHCSGHESDRSFVVLRMDNIEGVEIRNHGEYKELVLIWKK
jgi:hypothetical protein